MTPTNEQIMAEVRRRTTAVWGKGLEDTIIEVMREGWTPPEPEPVDPDMLAWREWYSGGKSHEIRENILAGVWDMAAEPYLAGARMAAERERERAKVLVEYVQDRRHEDTWADRALAKYRGEA